VTLPGADALTAVAPLPGASDSAPAGAVRPFDPARRAAELRAIRFQNGVAPHAAGSTLIAWGNTRVICAVTVEETVPRWMKDQAISGGWLTAEYSMLPYSTLERKPRDIARGRIDGRAQEIQRLIGRAMRAAVDLTQLGSRTLWLDCDVLQADGGTRTAAITGGYVALVLALRRLRQAGKLREEALRHSVAAVSLGLVGRQVLLDLNYAEDSSADVDLNLVMTGSGQFIELQGTGERATFSGDQLNGLLAAGRQAIATLTALQQAAIAQG